MRVHSVRYVLQEIKEEKNVKYGRNGISVCDSFCHTHLISVGILDFLFEKKVRRRILF